MRRTLCLMLVFVAILSSCATLADMFSHTNYSYQLDEIASLNGIRPEYRWMYPGRDQMTLVSGEENFHGTSYNVDEVDNVPLWGQEPPMVMDWRMGPNGSIIIAEAMEYEVEMRMGETGIHPFWIPNATKLRLYALDGETGAFLWEIPLEGFEADTLEWFNVNDEVMGVEFKQYGIRGTVESATYAAFQSDGSELLYQRTFQGNSRSFIAHRESETLQILFATLVEEESHGETISNLIRWWYSLDLMTGESLWQKELVDQQSILINPHGGLLLSHENGVMGLDHRSGQGEAIGELSGLQWIRVAGDLLVLGNPSEFQVYHLEDKRLLWTANGNYEDYSFNVVEGFLIAHNSSGSYEGIPQSAPNLNQYYKTWDPHNEDVYGFYENFTSRIEAFQLDSGSRILDREVDNRVTSSMVLQDNSLVFTTTKELIQLNLNTGDVTVNQELPWGIWPLGISISLYNQDILLETDRHVALWNEDQSFYRYHPFNPLWYSMSSDGLYYDLRAGYWVLNHMLGVPMDPNWVAASQDMTQDWYRGMQQSIESTQRMVEMARLNRDMTISRNNSYMDMKYNQYYGTNTNPYSYGIDRATSNLSNQMAALGSMVAWSHAVNLQAMGMMFTNNQACYALVKQQIGRLTELNQMPWIIRQTAGGSGNSTSQLEFFNLDTGETQILILGPRQAPDVVDMTMANGAVGLGVFGGYLHYTHLYSLNFRVLLDWDEQRIIYYGPGLEEENHVSFGRKKNLRNFIFSRELPIQD